MLYLQECWVEILRSVAEKIERGHQHDHRDDGPPVAGDRAEQILRVLFLLRRLPPNRRFGNVEIDEGDEQYRKRPNDEHAAPADAREEQREDGGGYQVPDRVALLQDARGEAACVDRNDLEDEGESHSPHAAHRHPYNVRSTSMTVRDGAK